MGLPLSNRGCGLASRGRGQLRGVRPEGGRPDPRAPSAARGRRRRPSRPGSRRVGHALPDARPTIGRSRPPGALFAVPRVRRPCFVVNAVEDPSSPGRDPRFDPSFADRPGQGSIPRAIPQGSVPGGMAPTRSREPSIQARSRGPSRQECGQLPPRGDVELDVAVAEVVLDGLDGHVQLSGHLAVGQAGGHQPGDGHLGAAEPQ
jgi:hypothetical protein